MILNEDMKVPFLSRHGREVPFLLKEKWVAVCIADGPSKPEGRCSFHSAFPAPLLCKGGYMHVIGTYRIASKMEYVCLYHPDEQVAEAVGPFPLPPQGTTRGTVVTTFASDMHQARMLLERSLGTGHWTQII